MKFTIKSTVPGNYRAIMDGFDRTLFEFLKPMGAKMSIVEFTGSQKGDVVHLEFKRPFKAIWISDIVEDGEDEKEAYFIDIGRVTPWPIKKWKHRHVVKKIKINKSVIEDQIDFTTGNIIFDMLMLPLMYLAFYPRKFQYKKYFK